MLKRKQQQQYLLYFFIVLLPTAIFSYSIWDKQENMIKNEHRREAFYMINIHKDQIDRLINETIARMETMALFIDQVDDEKHIQKVLADTVMQEPRFDGLYIVNLNGSVKMGTQKLADQIILQSNRCLKTALETKKTSVSDMPNNHLITMCTPIVHQNNKVNSLLYATLRIDYIKNIMNVLSPDLYIVVKNTDNEFIFNTGEKPADPQKEYVETDLSQLPWVLKAADTPIKPAEISQVIVPYAAIVFIFLNVVFLLIQYYLLKRNAKLEKERIEAQKLELIGTLAASTAHEIRNPLTGISGFIQLLKKKYQSEEDQQYFSIIEQEINRINEIVSEFLVLGKPTAHKHKHYNLIQIIDEVSPIIQSECNLHHATLQIKMDRSEPIWIYCTKDHIKQVILNLTKNALEAVDREDGALTIAAHREEELAVIQVMDNGKGIPDDLLEKIFDPFFTMKDNGTGLGLAICKRIVDMYDGDIHINSSIHQGTTVTLKFPAAKTPSEKQGS